MSKDSLEPKKLALLRILEILQRYSDEEHHLKQEDIIEYLERDYALSLERKAVARNLSLLKESGIEIESDKKGNWIKDRTFDNAELRILIDSILASRFISPARSKELIRKLCEQTSVYLRSNIKHIHTVDEWNKVDHPGLFQNIEILCDAIERHKPVRITQMIYGIDKKLHEGYVLSVTPAAIFIIEQEYLLLYVWDLNQGDADEGLYPVTMTALLRDLDRIRILEHEEPIDLTKVEIFRQSDNLPRFIRDNAVNKRGVVYTPDTCRLERISFFCKASDINTVLDRFGNEARITKLPVVDKELFAGDSLWDIGEVYENLIKVSVRTTKTAAITFVKSLTPYAGILSPEPVRKDYLDSIRFSLRAGEILSDRFLQSARPRNAKPD